MAAASLLQYTRFAFDYSCREFFTSRGDQDYTAIDIKVDGDDRWHRFEGVEDDYDSDGPSKMVYRGMFSVKAPGGKRRGR